MYVLFCLAEVRAGGDGACKLLPPGVPDGCLAAIKGSATTVGTLHQAKCWLDYALL